MHACPPPAQPIWERTPHRERCEFALVWVRARIRGRARFGLGVVEGSPPGGKARKTRASAIFWRACGALGIPTRLSIFLALLPSYFRGNFRNLVLLGRVRFPRKFLEICIHPKADSTQTDTDRTAARGQTRAPSSGAGSPQRTARPLPSLWPLGNRKTKLQETFITSFIPICADNQIC